MGSRKLVFSRRRLHKVLGLAPDVVVTGFYVHPDPLHLAVLIDSDRFEEVAPSPLDPDDVEVDIVHLNEALP